MSWRTSQGDGFSNQKRNRRPYDLCGFTLTKTRWLEILIRSSLRWSDHDQAPALLPAVASAHSLLGHSVADGRGDALARDWLPSRGLHCLRFRRWAADRRLRCRLHPARLA